MTKQELLDFLKANFTPIDNIPEDTAWRDAICMEARASLLIEANCTSERFPAFMKCGCSPTVGHLPSKQASAGSIPVSRSIISRKGDCFLC